MTLAPLFAPAKAVFMNAPIDNELASNDGWRSWEDRLAGPMFFLALVFLVISAGLIHRVPHLERDDREYLLILGALGILWPIFLIELAIRFRHRDHGRSIGKTALATVACG